VSSRLTECRLYPCSYFIIWMDKAGLTFRSGHTKHHDTTHHQSCHVSIHQSCCVRGATFYSVERRGEEVAVAGLAAVSDNWVTVVSVSGSISTSGLNSTQLTRSSAGRTNLTHCDMPTAQNVHERTGHYTAPAWAVTTYVYMYVCVCVWLCYIFCAKVFHINLPCPIYFTSSRLSLRCPHPKFWLRKLLNRR
jgi:hypothetical protein